MTLRFARYHGLGNDFVLVEGPLMDAARARRICDRHTGVGADGLILLGLEKTDPAEVTFRVFNADGPILGQMYQTIVRDWYNENITLRKYASPIAARNLANDIPDEAVDALLKVCEKNAGTVHDFSKDPIELVRRGDVMMANGTTLGADNGIAVATCLAIMEDRSLQHGPLEFLFTVDEETGLTGANALRGEMVKSRTLLNLDSEEDFLIHLLRKHPGQKAEMTIMMMMPSTMSAFPLLL